MAKITTYVCDISGVSDTKMDNFVEVVIKVKEFGKGYYNNNELIEKLVHYDVALKLGLVKPRTKEEEVPPTPTLESQLTALMKDYVADLVYDAVAEATGK